MVVKWVVAMADWTVDSKVDEMGVQRVALWVLQWVVAKAD